MTRTSAPDPQGRDSEPAPETFSPSGRSPRQAARTLRLLNPFALPRLIRRLRERLQHLEQTTDLLSASSAEHGERLQSQNRRLDGLEATARELQSEIEGVRDRRIPVVEHRLDSAEFTVASVSGETERLRDRVLPAAAARTDALVDRLAEELDELASLLERAIRREPLPVPAAQAGGEEALAEALADVQPRLLEAFRGPEAEVQHRLDRYLGLLSESAPVLELGAGRGELLQMLRDAGVEAAGVESDPALAGAARRRGLRIIEGDALEALRQQPSEALGAVCAIHLVEHLQPGRLLALLGEVFRVLRRGGLLLVESPNPHGLRVGASLFWLDPTHLRPLMPETLELFVTSRGFAVDRVELLHPFPEEQLFASQGRHLPEQLAPVQEELDRLRRRLDELVNAPRDFVMYARKPLDGGEAS